MCGLCIIQSNKKGEKTMSKLTTKQEFPEIRKEKSQKKIKFFLDVKGATEDIICHFGWKNENKYISFGEWKSTLDSKPNEWGQKSLKQAISFFEALKELERVMDAKADITFISSEKTFEARQIMNAFYDVFAAFEKADRLKDFRSCDDLIAFADMDKKIEVGVKFGNERGYVTGGGEEDGEGKAKAVTEYHKRFEQDEESVVLCVYAGDDYMHNDKGDTPIDSNMALWHMQGRYYKNIPCVHIDTKGQAGNRANRSLVFLNGTEVPLYVGTYEWQGEILENQFIDSLIGGLENCVGVLRTLLKQNDKDENLSDRD